MVQTQAEVQANFTAPVRQLITMIVVLGLVAGGSYVAWPSVSPVFLTR